MLQPVLGLEMFPHFSSTVVDHYPTMKQAKLSHPLRTIFNILEIRHCWESEYNLKNGPLALIDPFSLLICLLLSWQTARNAWVQALHLVTCKDCIDAGSSGTCIWCHAYERISFRGDQIREKHGFILQARSVSTSASIASQAQSAEEQEDLDCSHRGLEKLNSKQNVGCSSRFMASLLTLPSPHKARPEWCILPRICCVAGLQVIKRSSIPFPIDYCLR